MQLARFLNKLFKTGGFVLIDSNLKKYIIGSPEKDNPITIKLLDKKLHYKLLFFPDLYLGEAYADGTLKIENGDLTDFLNLALKNLGKKETNIFL
jgi:cyclopropane-fatty-acyl-phospholipid synthase